MPLSPILKACRTLLTLYVTALAPAQAAGPPVELPKTALDATEIAIVVNEEDPLSVRIGDYYRTRRGIPEANVLRVRFQANTPTLPDSLFNSVRAQVLRQSGPQIQAYALAWTLPYRVNCMSITSAFAFGFDAAYCSAKQCAPTKPSVYFNSQTHAPFTDLQIRPAMLLAGRDIEAVKRLIDRGIAADHSYPDHTGYLLNTSDSRRSVRAAFFEQTVKALGDAIRLEKLDADSVKDKSDVMFYFTGSVRVGNLDSLRFVPGAIADHLTSAGGILEGDGQMSSLRWLEAGATGSYGAVVEPCNHLQKFPLPAAAIWHYAEGESLIEAYWKSVAWPGEGVFIGEPLAKPYAPRLTHPSDRQARLELFSPAVKSLSLEAAASPIGPYLRQAVYLLKAGKNQLDIPLPDPNLLYRLVF